MPRFVAFARAFNVAGHPRAAMSELCGVFSAAGCAAVRSQGQAGNVIFELPAGALIGALQQVRESCRARFGEAPEILVRPAAAVAALAEQPPFAAADLAPRRDLKLYVAFLAAPPARPPLLPMVDDKEGLTAIAVRGTEAFIVSRPKASRFFGMPNIFIERELGVVATCRNWSTVTKLAALLASAPAQSA